MYKVNGESGCTRVKETLQARKVQIANDIGNKKKKNRRKRNHDREHSKCMKLDSDRNPSRVENQPFSQMTTKKIIEKKEVLDGLWRKGKGVIRSVKIDNKQNQGKTSCSSIGWHCKMFFHMSAVGISI